MSFWQNLFKKKTAGSVPSYAAKADYLKEALGQERSGDYDGAIVSLRLALRAKPNDAQLLANMGIVHTRMRRLDDAMKYYREALNTNPLHAGAHYGLAFLYLKHKSDTMAAQQHLNGFLGNAPMNGEATEQVSHAQRTLAAIQASFASSRQAPDYGTRADAYVAH